MFSGYCFYVFFFFFEIFIYVRFFYYLTRSMKIIKGRRHLVLTEESPRLTMMAVFAGVYTRSLFPLPAFLNDVAGIHPGLIKLNEIKTPVLEFFHMHRTRFAVLQYFVSSQELSCHHKPISNRKLTDPSASSGSPRSRDITDTQPGLN